MSDALERFEEMAERFRRETGYMHPGKDAPSNGPQDDYGVRAAVLGVWQRMNLKHSVTNARNGRYRELLEECHALLGCFPLHPDTQPLRDRIDEALAKQDAP